MSIALDCFLIISFGNSELSLMEVRQMNDNLAEYDEKHS